MAIEGSETTLRDTLTAKFAEAEAQATEAPEVQAPAVEAPAPSAETAPAGETAEQRAGRTAGRPRDEKGRLLPGAPVKPNAVPQAQTQPVASPAIPAQPAPAAAAPIQRPSSWKKEHWSDFDKLAAENPALAQYLVQREQEFSKGVSTYKQEWDNAKPMLDAVAPFMPLLRQHGIEPAQMTANLFRAHQALALGSPQEKMGLFQKLISDYGIPAQLAVQGQDGQWQLLGQQPQPQQPQFNPQDIEKLVDQRLETRTLQQQIDAFLGNTEKYPHAKTVMQTMQGLLQAGLANSLDDAYEAALRHPRHADLYEAQQQQQRDQQEAARVAAEQKRVSAARAKTVSTPTSTPGGPGNGQGTPSLRDSLRQKLEAAGAGGRL